MNIWDAGEVRGWRRAEMFDTKVIEELMNVTEDNTNLIYNFPKIDHLIEKSCFPIVQVDVVGNIVSFAAFKPFPNVPSVPPSCWVEWIQNQYRFMDANSNNSLFIHCIVRHPSQEEKYFSLLLETTFYEFPLLKYIIFIKPPFVDVPQHYSEYFTPVLPCSPGDENSCYSLQSVNICQRNLVIERLHIRKALAEDSDDVMSLLKENNLDSIEKLYGEYFLAELLERPGIPDRHILVCEHEGIAAGVMGINLYVDLDFLAEEFELIPFHGLRKIVVEDNVISNLPIEPVNSHGKEFLFDQLNFQDDDLLNLLDLGTSVFEIKGFESSSSSGSLFEIEYPVLDQSSSFRKKVESLEDLTSEENSVLAEWVQTKSDNNIGISGKGTASKMHLPKYKGPSNAFAIELFITDNSKINERLLTDFLEAAFEIASDRDYCVITIPSELLPLPLLNSFIRVGHQPMKQLRQELYICHRNYLSSSSVLVRRTESSDLEEIQLFLEVINNSEDINAQFQRSLQDSFNQSFALTSKNKIVGLALIRCQPNLDDLSLYFNILDFSLLDLHENEDKALLRHLLLAPPYHAFGRLFLLEIMRLADVTCFFHLYCDDIRLNGSILSVLRELTQIKPRKTIECCNPPSDDIELLDFRNPFALFFTNPRMCGRLKHDVNKIIVVVGASTTALSFFENIVFGSSQDHLSCNNLIWVSPHGIEQDLPPNKIRDLMFPIRNKYSKNYEKMISLQAHINLVYGVMTGINRDEKYVILNRSTVLKYDVLVLTLGLQFLRPVPEVATHKSKKGKQIGCHKKYFSESSRFLQSQFQESETELVNPVNMFLINTYLEAEKALLSLEYIKKNLKPDVVFDKKIIVYGHNLRVFLLLQAIMKLGIPGEVIAFVEPFPCREASISAFGDLSIDEEVMNNIRNYEIQHYPEHFFYDWNFASPEQITSVTFHSSNSQVTLPCLAFIPMVRKLVSDINFKACNEAKLVYDGKLIIDSNFKTNDKRIFAAGPFTKYSRRYYSPGRNHQYYNSAEVGEKLAEFIQQEMNPFAEERQESGDDVDVSSSSDFLPKLEKPLMVYCQLPGDFYYFSLRKPGRPVDMNSSFIHGRISDVLITGDCQMSKGCGYFRLNLDQYGNIQEILCFNNDEIEYMNLYKLYGLNEKLLNNMLMRFDCGMINDFYEYFKQPWAEAIFHSHFPRVMRHNMRTLLGQTPDIMKHYINNLNSFARRRQPIPEATRANIELAYQELGLKSEVERNLLQFLNYFDNELKSYATPKKLHELFLKRDLMKGETDNEERNRGEW